MTAGAADTTQNGDVDAFVTKVATAPAQAPNFTLTASPSGQEVVRGNAVTYTVTVNPSGGFAGSVSLSVSGLPNAATASFSPNPTSSSSTLTVQTGATTTPGSYTLTITGTSGTITRTTTVGLSVHCCPRP